LRELIVARLESCPTCGNQTSENARQCPACAEPLSSGWADAVVEEREEEERREEAEREEEEIEEEEKAAQRAVVRAAKAQKKDSRKRLLTWGSILGILIFIYGPGMYDDYTLRNLKDTNPAEYQERIQNLEAQVVKVPKSNFNKKIRLYQKLKKLNPDSVQYVEKISLYQKKQN